MVNKCRSGWWAVAASALIALSVTDNVWAGGSSTGACTQSGSSLATSVMNLKGTYSCADIQGRTPISGNITANADGSINWSTSANAGDPIVTEVLVQGTNGGNTCEYVYTGKANSGNSLGYLKSTGSYQGVQGVALCTDGSTVPTPPAPKTIPNCGTTTGFDGLGISCPANGATSIIYNFEVGKPFFNTSGTDMACVCGNGGQPLQQCDPNLPAGTPTQSGQLPACPAQPAPTGTEVTTHVEINNDPYVCSTIGGTRTCYYYSY
jgi:hypothetical protein